MSRSHYRIFSPGKIGHLPLSNRLVRSATWDPAILRKRKMTGEVLDLYARLAAGGVGLIITGDFSVIPPHALDNPNCSALACSYDDARIEGFGLLPNVVRNSASDCKIVAQISADFPGIAPSEISSRFSTRKPKVLSTEQVRFIIRCLAECISGVKQEGFDGVQLHAAHGGVLSQFLSPHTNRREDEYGGSLSNRVRIIRESVLLARDRVGDFPILIKLNGTDYLEGGIDIENLPELARKIEAAGIDAIEVSGGMVDCLARPESELGFRAVPKPESQTRLGHPDKQSYFLDYAQSLDAKIPVILVGGNRDVECLEKILRQEKVDFIAMCRPLISEPDLPRRWLEGRGSSGTDCISCNACIWDMSDSLKKGKTWVAVCVFKHDKERFRTAEEWLSTWVERMIVS